MNRTSDATNEWYSPPACIQDIIDWTVDWYAWPDFANVTDYCVSEESIAYTKAGLRTPKLYLPQRGFDALQVHTGLRWAGTQWLNPPYSKASEGAFAFLRAGMARHAHNFALINYSPWLGEAVRVLDLTVGIMDRRVCFEAGPALQAKREAEGKKPNPNSPQYNNVFLYNGEAFVEDLPTRIGEYEVVWLS
jgi:hypothetical protein